MRYEPTRERGEAALLATAFAIIVLAALALPAYEYGRMLNDKTVAASAAADTAKMVAADPEITTAELERYLDSAYPGIADAVVLTVKCDPDESVDYSERVYEEQTGSFVLRPSTVTSSTVTATVSVTRPFVTGAATFVSSLVGGSGSYTVVSSGMSVADKTVSSGRW